MMKTASARPVATLCLLAGAVLVTYAAFAHTWARWSGSSLGLLGIRTCDVALEAGAPTNCRHWSVFDGSMGQVTVTGVVTFVADVVTAALALLAVVMMWMPRRRRVWFALPRIVAAIAAASAIAFVVTGKLTPLDIAAYVQFVGCVLVLLGDGLAVDAARE